ncbi:hypothetical protein J7355_16680 [Endozoicomonas sp. G2_2]|uniref:hypothetical protein n=1 Tax=Endozoicomonas sp. G2_2 TaxID=2821092 RepID=UPI001ADBC0BE|nr:hypothetical protein [Endozoicomonas sp. G2_2]MBO9471728.1 hypothetical protein [Endozoicomonas sp. G2_2]
MTNSDTKVVSLAAYRCAGSTVAVPDGVVRYGTPTDPDVIEVEDMPFSDLAKWIVEQTRVRETMMVQARIRFSGEGKGRVEMVTLRTKPDPDLYEAMPFEVSSSKDCAAMLNAYDYMVSQKRYPAETIIAGFADEWIALESPAESHGCVPKDAYEASAAWPV